MDSMNQMEHLSSETPSPNETSHNNNQSSDLAPHAAADAIAELDKMTKFKFEGRELTPQELRKAMLRQDDYTRKTKELSETRKSFDSEKKYYENLHLDLAAVKNNPQLASEFLKIYPEKFHSYLKQILGSTQSQQQSQAQQQQPQQDFETMSRLAKLENFYHQQEIAKNETIINSAVDKFSKIYPDADRETVIARIYEAYSQGTKLDDSVWEREFKRADAQFNERVKAKYGDMVKKQSEANKKSRDVDSGGGTIGRAPKKMSFKEATDFAIKDLSSRGS